MADLSKKIQNTISEDRTHGSHYEVNSRSLAALDGSINNVRASQPQIHSGLSPVTIPNQQQPTNTSDRQSLAQTAEVPVANNAKPKAPKSGGGFLGFMAQGGLGKRHKSIASNAQNTASHHGNQMPRMTHPNELELNDYYNTEDLAIAQPRKPPGRNSNRKDRGLQRIRQAIEDEHERAIKDVLLTRGNSDAAPGYFHGPNDQLLPGTPFSQRQGLSSRGDSAIRRSPSPMLFNEPSRRNTGSPLLIQSKLPEVEQYQRGSESHGEQTAHDAINDSVANTDGLVTDPGYSSNENSPSDDDAIRLFARYLGIPEESALSPKKLQSYVSDIQYRATLASASNDPIPPEALTVHRTFPGERGRERMYLDKPRWSQGARKKEKVLTGDLPIDDLQEYLSRHPAMCFIIFRDYEVPATANYGYNKAVEHISECIQPVRKSLVDAIDMFLEHCKREMNVEEDEAQSVADSDHYESDSSYDEPDISNKPEYHVLKAPYVAIYHSRGKDIDTFLQRLYDKQREQFKLMLDFILSEYGKEYMAVDDLVARGKITNGLIQYLFNPGDVVVKGKDQNVQGYLCRSWPQVRSQKSRASNLPWPGAEAPREVAALLGLRIVTTHWQFDGNFTSVHPMLDMDIDMDDGSERDINELAFRPLHYAGEETAERLLRRGGWFWKCREPFMISYRGDKDRKLQGAAGGRYMIDMITYRKLHSKSISSNRKGSSTDLDLSSDIMDQAEPPRNEFIYLLPPKLSGYNLTTKKWVDLQVDKFSEVVWNTDAFQSLVLDGHTKRLIQALISDQIETEKSTDLISGKGNGLIMLLHGGPGTGKTLTAESVAEIARKPLYPVTCGDIGTEPRAVEEYLESVLYLGKVWGCVVLLDEADVFLQQRSLENLHRNALVSVFLRVLEYYDGILVLTSNRVGTLDEAFRSRIQLAIHYTDLTTHQRTKIWNTFFSRLKDLDEEGIDFVDLEDHVEQLAEHKMNGREIRNVITTARQFTRWTRKQPKTSATMLDYKVMEEIIETSGKFDKYIEKLNGGMTQEQLAEDEGLRLANGA